MRVSEDEIQECRKTGKQEENLPGRLSTNSFPAFLLSRLPDLNPGNRSPVFTVQLECRNPL
jgi:hypothetical protein